MVGYFNAEEGPGQQCGPVQEREAPVKRLVCSPDLPVFSLTQAFEEAAAAETSAASATATSPAATADKTSYECSFCHKTFPQKNTYQNHLRSHGKEGEDPYQCNICGKTFAVPARLTRHYRTHTGEKPYQCEYCSKSFSVKENLSVHRRIHTKERPYKCDICARAFEHSGKLHRHMRIHTGERPHKCSVCAKTFIQSGQLVIHMRTHTGEKPYVCAACGKGFTCSKQLKVHTRTHTGEKPYSCDICGKAFGYNHVLKLHQVAHYGEKVYKCTICSQTFTSKKTMEVHIKSHSESTAQPPRQSESSCASSSSDKENKGDSDCEPPPPAPGPYPQEQEQQPPLCYYLRPPVTTASPTGVNPVLLAVAAAASEGRSLSPLQEEVPLEQSLPVTEPSVYLCPEPLASMQRRASPYHFQLPPPEYLEEPVHLNLSSRPPDPLLTPPSSNPVSPVPSSSPDPMDLAAASSREVLILPPRKRSKMILKSMEAMPVEPVRSRSVIHYARAS